MMFQSAEEDGAATENEPTTSVGVHRARWMLGLAVALIVSVLVAGFWFATRFQSPAQQEANAKAPAAGPVFADVVRGSLAGEASFTGQIGPSTVTSVTVLPIPGASLTVVTGRPLEVGAIVSSGRVLTEVNGRPLFAVASPFSFYRDMGSGDRGPDVKALQGALAARGYPVAHDGVFGGETAAAAARWYRDNGYSAPLRDPAEAGKGGPGGGEASTDSDAETDNDMDRPARSVYVPVAELVAIPQESTQIVKGVQIGTQLAVEGQPDIVLGSADSVVTVTASIGEVGDVVAGDAVTISIDGADVEGTVGVIRAAGTPGADDAPESRAQEAEVESGDAGAGEVTFIVIPTGALPESAGRARVRITQQVVAEEALIVPILAVADRGAEKTVLTKRQDDDTLVEVPVIVLGALAGEVAVAPVNAGNLEAGDQVRVG
ncbi:hypothetical protein [Microbacterium aurugineum]